jgi:hypothetical protein
MKLLVILCSHEFNIKYSNNIKILHDYMSMLDVEYCGISNQDDFGNYETIINFKYKIINPKYQLSKLCDFITDNKSELDYDWYFKIRPDVKLLENINFDILSDNAINARARVYNGPKHIKYGLSTGGIGMWSNIRAVTYSSNEYDIILDDQLFIFNKKIIDRGGFDKIGEISGWWGNSENEWGHTQIYNKRNIPLNVIGLYVEFTKNNTFSGNI